MTVTNKQSGTRVDEIADGIYRINTPLPPSAFPGGFSFNQYLIKDQHPLLFHTGPRKLFPLVKQAIESVLPITKLRYVAFSHYEADECGSLNEFLAVAPNASPLCGKVAAMVSIDDVADRPAFALGDGETAHLGQHDFVWYDTPHLPHAWECGLAFEKSTGTLLCGDLFTQPGTGDEAVTEKDILGPSEAFRKQFDYFSHTKNANAMFEKMAKLKPKMLACMHGSAWRGDGAKLLKALSAALA
jgi:flavorubredoxin